MAVWYAVGWVSRSGVGGRAVARGPAGGVGFVDGQQAHHNPTPLALALLTNFKPKILNEKTGKNHKPKSKNSLILKNHIKVKSTQIQSKSK